MTLTNWKSFPKLFSFKTNVSSTRQMLRRFNKASSKYPLKPTSWKKHSCKLWLKISEVSWSSCWTGWTCLGTRLSSSSRGTSQSSLWSITIITTQYIVVVIILITSTKYWQLHNFHMDNSHCHLWSGLSAYPLIHLLSTYPLIIHLSSTYQAVLSHHDQINKPGGVRSESRRILYFQKRVSPHSIWSSTIFAILINAEN